MLDSTKGALPAATLSGRRRADANNARAPRTAYVTLLEVAGIEPASSGTSAGLLRAQLAVRFSALPVTPASQERAQPRAFTTRPRGHDGWWSS